MLIGCTSTADLSINTVEDQLDKVFADFEEFNGSVCLGISGPYEDKTKAILKATDNCAEMLAISKALIMQDDIEIKVDTSRNKDSFNLKSIGIYDDSIYHNALNTMEILDIKWYGGDIGAVVYAKLAEPIDWSHDTNWITNKIIINGFNCDVGQTFEYYYIQDSLEAAAFDAAVNLSLSESTLTISDSYTVITDKSMTQHIDQISVDSISDFRILSFEYDKDTRTYYALAICKQE